MRVSARRLTPIFEDISSEMGCEEEFSSGFLSAAIQTELLDTIATLIDQTTSLPSRTGFGIGTSIPFWPWFWMGGSFEELVLLVQERRKEIAEVREKTRPFLLPIPALETVLTESGTYLIDPARLALISNGISGSYFLSDGKGKPLFIVKPFDEDIAGLNNPKGFGSPNGPILLAAFREIAVYRTALSIGVDSIAPPTALAILESDGFFDIADKTTHSELGPADKEKLCSLQEFVPNSKTLFEASQDLQQEGLSDAEIAARFDQEDFENANILLWATGETDGHSGNFLAYPKGTDELGHEIFGLKKIDNGLSFPDINGGFFNSLTYLPNARETLSEAGREKILAIDPDEIASVLRENGLEGSIQPMRERIDLLKSLALEPSITIKEINKTLTKNGNRT